jgi:hypothetical protein
MSSDDVEETPCPLCQSVPCLLRQGLYDSIVEFEESIRDGDHEGTITNKEVRFRLYRHATMWIHGFLGKGKRIELPQCVRTEILDLAPESDRVYVGFQDSSS